MPVWALEFGAGDGLGQACQRGAMIVETASHIARPLFRATYELATGSVDGQARTRQG